MKASICGLALALVWSTVATAQMPTNIDAFGKTDVKIVPTEVKSMGSATTLDQEQIVDAMRTMYSALSSDDVAQFRSVTAPGFFAYELGKRLTGDELLAVIKARHDEGVVFVWRITEPDVRIDGNMGWITYANRGSITDAAGTKAMGWLESAVLRRDAGAWRIEFLHSTRMP